jgi:hypothetical protein
MRKSKKGTKEAKGTKETEDALPSTQSDFDKIFKGIKGDDIGQQMSYTEKLAVLLENLWESDRQPELNLLLTRTVTP